MVTRIGTKQRKTRHKLLRNYREKGKLSVSKYFQEFKKGEKVGLKLHPAVQKGRFYPRFHGFTGTITGKIQGSCYEVKIRDGDKEKLVLVHPIHLNLQHAQP